MSSLSPFLSVDCTCDEALRWSSQRLRESGFRPVQTFDLQAARLGLEDCPCPHHGTGRCDCQMIVLFIYPEGAEPAVLILHGSDGKTWLSLVDGAGQKPDPKTVAAIKAAVCAQSW